MANKHDLILWQCSRQQHLSGPRVDCDINKVEIEVDHTNASIKLRISLKSGRLMIQINYCELYLKEYVI